MRYAIEFEYLEVAQAWGRWGDFDQLDSDTQALLIAHWRTKQRFAAVDSWQRHLKGK